MLKRMVIWLGIVVVIAVVAVLALVALTPHDHKVELLVTFPRTPPEQVWNLLTDHASEPEWLPAFASAELQTDQLGRAVWTYRSPDGAFSPTLMTISAVPEKRYERLLLREGQPRSQLWDGRWVFDLEPEGEGTRMKITEYGWTGGFKFFIVQRILGSPDTFLKFYARRMGVALDDPAQIEVLRAH